MFAGLRDTDFVSARVCRKGQHVRRLTATKGLHFENEMEGMIHGNSILLVYIPFVVFVSALLLFHVKLLLLIQLVQVPSFTRYWALLKSFAH